MQYITKTPTLTPSEAIKISCIDLAIKEAKLALTLGSPMSKHELKTYVEKRALQFENLVSEE